MAAIPNSILDTTKKILGIDPNDDVFDIDVITHINSAFAQLAQLGVGPADGFEIEDNTKLWADYLGTNKLINSVKTYMYLKVRMWFDPPNTSFDQTAKKEQITELEWRLNVAADKGVQTPWPTVPGWISQMDEFIDNYVAEHPFADFYIHKQTTPAANWSITNPLTHEPTVQVYAEGSLVTVTPIIVGDVVTIQLPAPAVGIAVLS